MASKISFIFALFFGAIVGAGAFASDLSIGLSDSTAAYFCPELFLSSSEPAEDRLFNAYLRALDAYLAGSSDPSARLDALRKTKSYYRLPTGGDRTAADFVGRVGKGLESGELAVDRAAFDQRVSEHLESIAGKTSEGARIIEAEIEKTRERRNPIRSALTWDFKAYSVEVSPDFSAALVNAPIRSKTQVGHAALIDLKTGAVLREFHGDPGEPLRNVHANADWSQIIAVSKKIHVWDLKTGNELAWPDRFGNDVGSIAVSSDFSRIVYSDPSGVRVWNSGDAEAELLGPAEGSAFSVQGDEGLHRVVFLRSGQVEYWNLDTVERIAKKKYSTDRTPPIVADFGSDRILFSEFVKDKGTYLRDVREGSAFFSLSPSEGSFIGADSKGERVAFGNSSGDITIWDLKTRAKTKTLKGHQFRAHVIQFSEDGKLAFSSGGDSNLILWDLESEKVLTRVRDTGAGVPTIAFSSDQSEVFVSGENRLISIWDISMIRHGQ